MNVSALCAFLCPPHSFPKCHWGGREADGQWVGALLALCWQRLALP